jgi:hypothetical protein
MRINKDERNRSIYREQRYMDKRNFAACRDLKFVTSR